MAITVVGSVAFDTVETPAGRRERCLAGAATYFSLAASYFTQVRVIAVVGEDFGADQQAVFDAHKIDTRGIERAPGKSFFWQGSYLENLNEAKTLKTDLNVFRGIRAQDSRRLSRLGISLSRQHRSRSPAARARSHSQRAARRRRHHELLDQGPQAGAARSAQGSRHPPHQRHRDAHACRQPQPRAGRARRAGHGPAHAGRQARRIWGYTFFHGASPRGKSAERTFRAPALPLEEVVDPTGAGDSFAGGFFGYLASQPELTPGAFRRAMFYGCVMGSFAVERFGTERCRSSPARRSTIASHFSAS